MPVVDKNRLKGNRGELHVANRLADLCLVRPVPSGTDVGIDLFCESLSGSQPFLHFWIQVKTGSQCKVDKTSETASCSFTTDPLAYWSRQPVPVFAVLVPSDLSITSEPDIYIVDVTVHLLKSPIKKGQMTQTLRSQCVWRAGDRDGICAFLEQQVPTSTALLKLKDGIIAPTPSLEENYFKAIPMVPILRYSNKILTQVRRTAAFSILSLKVAGEHGNASASFRRRLAHVLELFDDDLHWETHAAKAFSHHLDGEFGKAIEQYDRALEIIKCDSHTKGLREWESRVKELQKNREKALSEREF